MCNCWKSCGKRDRAAEPSNSKVVEGAADLLVHVDQGERCGGDVLPVIGTKACRGTFGSQASKVCGNGPFRAVKSQLVVLPDASQEIHV
jgi:hypothetical protein